MVTLTACVDPVATTYSQWPAPLPTAAMKPFAVSALISAAEGQVKTSAATSTDNGADLDAIDPDPLTAGGVSEARLVDFPLTDPLVHPVLNTVTVTTMASHLGIHRCINVKRCIVSLPGKCVPANGAAAPVPQKVRCVNRNTAECARWVMRDACSQCP
jgi:hypothetical protein